ncbi:hypothetical protein OU789_02660 [Halocynthiibacter sp. C4]|uniref:terminase gpP N-terminus-related DNA-binding protein n=1 Tax=Halocynthiibacter sp. C4 TaxID=2992758 RepID=UPI00237A96BE|nr:hypothetical protein [Halocynthiibacter sp. C4]MDE0588824.1 hypothetical protein [Halocynthiibacter sp. C4]
MTSTDATGDTDDDFELLYKAEVFEDPVFALKLINLISVNDWRIDTLKSLLERGVFPAERDWLAATQAILEHRPRSSFHTINKDRSVNRRKRRQRAKELKSKGYAVKQIAHMLGVSEPSVYRDLKD